MAEEASKVSKELAVAVESWLVIRHQQHHFMTQDVLIFVLISKLISFPSRFNFFLQQLETMSLQEKPADAPAPAAAAPTADAPAGGEKKLSKNQLKKLAKGKGKKDKKDKPKWNQPGEGKKKKDDAKSKALTLPKPEFVNTTPKGHKKDLSATPMADAYHPQAVEAAWQDWWEECGFYSCDPKTAEGKSEDEKFVMVIPPPNVTGSLHLGHALTAAVEDTLTRWHRMLGHSTLYVPGELNMS